MTSILFNIGTLILSILILEWYSIISFLATFLVQFTILMLVSVPKMQLLYQKIGVNPKSKRRRESPMKENDCKKIGKSKILTSLYTSWANMFMLTRVVQDKTYTRIIYSTFYQPVHFLLNLVMLIILSTMLQVSDIASRYDPSLIFKLELATAMLIIVGILHVIMVYFYFYEQDRCNCWKKEQEEMTNKRSEEEETEMAKK